MALLDAVVYFGVPFDASEAFNYQLCIVYRIAIENVRTYGGYIYIPQNRRQCRFDVPSLARRLDTFHHCSSPRPHAGVGV